MRVIADSPCRIQRQREIHGVDQLVVGERLDEKSTAPPFSAFRHTSTSANPEMTTIGIDGRSDAC